MRIIPLKVWHRLSNAKQAEAVTRSRQPVLPEEIFHLPRLHDPHSTLIEKIASDSRVVIIEGISGSGKDTLQTYLKTQLKHRDVHDYTEGELLQSWNQLQIGGIFELRIKFMMLFMKYLENVLIRDDKAIFLLNRFHLSAYAMTITQQPQLERDYENIITVLRTLPVHVFILQLAENEIDKRSMHPERSRAWHKFQQQIIEKDGFQDRVDRYIWQQKVMLETAEKQQIPYTVIKPPALSEIDCSRVQATKTLDPVEAKAVPESSEPLYEEN